MLRIPTFFVIGFIIFGYSCKQEEKLNNCANVNCVPPSILLRLKFEDNKTGNDLLFGLNKKYVLNDVTIYSSRLKKDLEFKVDSSDSRSNSIIFISNSSDEFAISLAGKKVDVLKVETKFLKEDCCGTLQLSSLVSNNFNSSLANANQNLIVIKI